jgi:hypothetical protein
VRRTDLSALAADGGVLFAALVEPVARARYWQEPDEADSMLADPAVAAELRPVAEAIAASPAAQWWWSPVARSDEQHVSFPAADGELRPPDLVAHGCDDCRRGTGRLDQGTRRPGAVVAALRIRSRRRPSAG